MMAAWHCALDHLPDAGPIPVRLAPVCVSITDFLSARLGTLLAMTGFTKR